MAETREKGLALTGAILIVKNEKINYSAIKLFGFKPKHSTTGCTFILRETAQYYNNRGSNLYCLLLDASQAFDRVHYIKLFKLCKMGLCFVSARFLCICILDKN